MSDDKPLEGITAEAVLDRISAILNEVTAGGNFTEADGLDAISELMDNEGWL